MTHPVQFARVALHPSKSLDIHDGRGTTLTVQEGDVWITQADDIRDVVLKPGQSFTINRDGLTLATALAAPAVITIAPSRVATVDMHRYAAAA
jgi:hypothetical protein